MASGFAPRRQTANDYERVESLVHQQVRHPGARSFACSSTVEVNVLVFGQVFDLFLKIVRFDPD
jgi:hypothetical protein